MSQCPFNSQIDAYYDGELDRHAAEALFAHRTQCAPCAGELAWRKSLSQAFASTAPADLSQIALYRIHHGIARVTSEGFVRVAHIVQGIAAAILVVASIWLARGTHVSTPNKAEIAGVYTAPPWVQAGVVADSDGASQAVNTPAATWYLGNSGLPADETP